jgi:tRNA (guanine37-N1)-methyltransferase
LLKHAVKRGLGVKGSLIKLIRHALNVKAPIIFDGPAQEISGRRRKNAPFTITGQYPFIGTRGRFPAALIIFAPMRIDIISVLPELLESPLTHSIMKRARDKGLLEIHIHPLRQWAINEYGQVDDYQYGGGAGMVMMPEPLANAIEALSKDIRYDEIIYMTPDGEDFNQGIANQFSMKENLLIICGHYKGIDQRIRDHFVTKEISIGNYVLSGGELAAAVVVDAVGRLLPGVLNNETSALFDSFQDNLLAPPVYTRPADFRGWKVPDILLSGDLKKIEDWRYEQAVQRTTERKPDLLKD